MARREPSPFCVKVGINRRMLLLLLACQNENAVEQACFVAYLNAREADDTAYFACVAAEDDGCAESFTSDAAGSQAELGACAEDGCVADWLVCTESGDDLGCFETLDTCGGWVSAGIVGDCFTDVNACGNSEGCMNDYYDCMRYAAGA